MIAAARPNAVHPLRAACAGRSAPRFWPTSAIAAVPNAAPARYPRASHCSAMPWAAAGVVPRRLTMREEPQLAGRDRQAIHRGRDAHPQQPPDQRHIGHEVRPGELEPGLPPGEYDQEHDAADEVREPRPERDADEAESAPRTHAEAQPPRQRHVEHRHAAQDLEPGPRVAGSGQARHARRLRDLKHEQRRQRRQERAAILRRVPVKLQQLDQVRQPQQGPRPTPARRRTPRAPPPARWRAARPAQSPRPTNRATSAVAPTLTITV